LKRIIILLLLSVITSYTYSQNQHIKTATKSAIIPGLGQMENKKYYKVPLIYAGIGVGIFFFNKNNNMFKNYKDTYLNRLNGVIFNDPYPQYTDSQLLILSDYYNRNRDISILGTFAVYLINIIDAYVDSHLIKFDISDNLEVNNDNITIYFKF
tara:strand:- start:191 stop:652 length:462 start_codon:yes stop_codon:yes gene_type:complete